MVAAVTKSKQLLQQQIPPGHRHLITLLASLLLLTVLLTLSFHLNSRTPLHSTASFTLFEEHHLRPPPPASTRAVPRLAYLLSGSRGDCFALLRALRALYHPHNFYVVHLDLAAPASERLRLADLIGEDPHLAAAGNVRVIEKSNLVTYRGPTMVTTTLHAAAVALKEGGDWDWFINLSASDYPLVTQDDLLYVLAGVPRHLNFLDHTSDIGWKENQRALPVIVDPGFYRTEKSDIFWASRKRSVPTAFKLFTGSAWMMLSHHFVVYCLWGWDNLPRTVLMYYANFLSSPEGYFHTVICNAEEFRRTAVNHDLHFISWDNPPGQHPHFLNLVDFEKMVASNAPFARKFCQEEPVLDRIDSELLGRDPDSFTPSGWHEEGNASSGVFHQFKRVESVDELRPGPGAKRLKKLFHGLLHDGAGKQHCI